MRCRDRSSGLPKRRPSHQAGPAIGVAQVQPLRRTTASTISTLPLTPISRVWPLALRATVRAYSRTRSPTASVELEALAQTLSDRSYRRKSGSWRVWPAARRRFSDRARHHQSVDVGRCADRQVCSVGSFGMQDVSSAPTTNQRAASATWTSGSHRVPVGRYRPHVLRASAFGRPTLAKQIRWSHARRCVTLAHGGRMDLRYRFDAERLPEQFRSLARPPPKAHWRGSPTASTRKRPCARTQLH